MIDPVLLPSSKVIVDRRNIERHLMSEPSDPFNRYGALPISLIIAFMHYTTCSVLMTICQMAALFRPNPTYRVHQPKALHAAT